jgi:hypothetical protein
LDFTHPARDDRQRGETVFDGDVSAPTFEVMMTDVNADVLCPPKKKMTIRDQALERG